MQTEIRSYTSLDDQKGGGLRESFQLLRKSFQSSRHLSDDVAHHLQVCRDAEALVISQTGAPLENLDVLELGPGQLPRQTAYFALKNRVTAIDLDVIPEGFSSYLQLLRQNGPKRLIKTLARKLLGYDRRFRAELRRQLHVDRLPRATILQMDATRTTFPDNSFDFTYSFDTFEHFPDPTAVLRELHRILRPAGRVLTVIHPWTCDTGSHDMRLYLPGRADLPYWPHLRPTTRDQIQSFAYLNRLTLAQWRETFLSIFPNSTFTPWRWDPQAVSALAQARAAGELTEYSDDELLTDRLVVVSQK
jgi:SAM-dependent methyltransferase